MRDLLPDLDRWHGDHDSIALATVIQTWGSAPRRAGSMMALTLDGKISGSVSGGCVESAVVEAGIESLQSGQPRLLHFGVSDETAWEVGLACGGTIEVFVQPLAPDAFRARRAALLDEVSAACATIVRSSAEILGREILLREDGTLTGSVGPDWDESVLRLARQALADGTTRRVPLDESVEVFVESILPPPTIVVVGGAHIAMALVTLAKTLGYRTIVIDPRKAWGNARRFPNVDQLIQAWPEEAFKQLPLTRSTAVVMLSHDPKLDDPALKITLPGPAFYVGALGSRSTQVKRRERLLEAGLSEAQVARLHAPIGLPIGAETPEEIALAIMAQVVEAAHQQARQGEAQVH
ncbi:MAG TPA: XdhC/CoxI family protein [Anaerolineales bacterium]|jgi:xanthine dehydrogenase accessory factor